MDRGTIVLNKLTGERILFFREQKEEIKECVKSNVNNFQFVVFEKYTDEEKYTTILHNFNKMVEFDNSVRGSGRTYDSSIRIGINEMKWIIEKLNI